MKRYGIPISPNDAEPGMLVSFLYPVRFSGKLVKHIGTVNEVFDNYLNITATEISIGHPVVTERTEYKNKKFIELMKIDTIAPDPNPGYQFALA